MDGLMRGLPKVCVYMYDILVSGTMEQEHLSNLDEVLHRLETAGMRLKRDKCQFLMSEVEYLGHKINEQGIQPTASKVRAMPCARGCDSTPFVSRTRELLREVLSQPLHDPHSTLQTAEEGSTMGVGRRAEEGLPITESVGVFRRK